MRRRWSVAATLTMLVLASVSSTGPTPAAPGRADPAGGPDPVALPAGAPARTVWFSGRTVHTAAGLSVTLPLSRDSTYRLLGRSRGSWVLEARRPRDTIARVLTVRGSVVRTVWRYNDEEPAVGFLLARHGDRVLQVYDDRSGTSEVTVFDLTGRRVADRSWGRFVAILDAAGDRILIGGRQTLSWAPPDRPSVIAGDAIDADVAHDVLFVTVPPAGDAGNEMVGPTSLSAPGAPTWTADFEPIAVSPGGQWVAGVDGRTERRLEIRSMGDGALQPTSGLRTDGTELAWEDDNAVLVGETTRRGDTLVRCSLTGSCERATAWQPQASLSLPYQDP